MLVVLVCVGVGVAVTPCVSVLVHGDGCCGVVRVGVL